MLRHLTQESLSLKHCLGRRPQHQHSPARLVSLDSGLRPMDLQCRLTLRFCSAAGSEPMPTPVFLYMQALVPDTSPGTSLPFRTRHLTTTGPIREHPVSHLPLWSWFPICSSALPVVSVCKLCDLDQFCVCCISVPYNFSWLTVSFYDVSFYTTG